MWISYELKFLEIVVKSKRKIMLLEIGLKHAYVDWVSPIQNFFFSMIVQMIKTKLPSTNQASNGSSKQPNYLFIYLFFEIKTM